MPRNRNNRSRQRRDGRIRPPPPPAALTCRCAPMCCAGGSTSNLGRRKLGFSVSGRARIGGKAALTGLVGSKDGLGAEGRYVREVLPRPVVNDLSAARRDRRWTGPYGARLRQNPPQRGGRSSLQAPVFTGPRQASVAVVDGSGDSSKLRAFAGRPRQLRHARMSAPRTPTK
jgi:hypothetical protein